MICSRDKFIQQKQICFTNERCDLSKRKIWFVKKKNILENIWENIWGNMRKKRHKLAVNGWPNPQPDWKNSSQRQPCFCFHINMKTVFLPKNMKRFSSQKIWKRFSSQKIWKVSLPKNMKKAFFTNQLTTKQDLKCCSTSFSSLETWSLLHFPFAW